MSAENQWPNKLWRETPLIRSPHISELLDCNAYLKLEVSANRNQLSELISNL